MRLVTIGMARPGKKLENFRQLADAPHADRGCPRGGSMRSAAAQR